MNVDVFFPVEMSLATFRAAIAVIWAPFYF